MHIGLNAQLLAPEGTYRAAGIHNVIHNLLVYMPEQAPADWRFTAMVSPRIDTDYPGIRLQHAPFDTTSPLKRIFWEQVLQASTLRQFNLYHAMAFVAPAYCPLPMVVTVYDLTFLRYPERLSRARRLYLQAFSEKSCRMARRIIAISHSTKNDLVELLRLPADKIDVTQLGYDRDRFRPASDEDIAAFKAAHNLPERFWLSLGTLEPRKNLLTLIEAYAQLPPDDRLPLVLAGGKGWDYEPIFEAIDKHDLTDSISTPGFIPSEDIALWYNSAEVFVYPSVFEGFGLPVLEAMACGTPVITSNVSSLPEVAEGAGMTLPPHEVDAWVAALHQARDDAAWRTTASEAGLRKAASFTWEETAKRTIESYERALG